MDCEPCAGSKSMKHAIVNFSLTSLVCLSWPNICSAGPANVPTHKVGAVTRTIVFPPDVSIGELDICEPKHLDSTLESPTALSTQHVGTAKGVVHITVPAGHLLKLTLNHNCFSHPKLLDTLPPDALDAVAVHFASMADSEDHLCDAALAHVARLTNLQYLSIDRSDTSDAGLSQIKTLTKLRQLTAFATSITG